MSAQGPFLNALQAAQTGQSFTATIQSAASGINSEVLKSAIDTILAGGDEATVEGDLAAALKAGFEFAAALVLALTKEPGVDEKLDVRVP